MQKLPKIGLPVILIVLATLIFASKSSINIGYGEAGVLFRTFGGGVVTDAPPLEKVFILLLLGIVFMFIMSNNRNFLKEICRYCPPTV